ncbi:DNA (cytosine-5)-methyltransferase 1 [Microcella putealis]|uniref:Cytosine-specific methyltransferase n=1 Tax=Microcella putealis TaxID=337005 RepID=A0A4Q7LNW6_9MICO|nr:DNA cytosine methyltransferase [Microcella putealis]RZS55229.1 DNA (cytosine-5)-methyltransferase 1 [Microcella putealis]TQM23509.1 DNA (cytosine-5)-methyltransferase 1 [Microcella putealis]
MSNPITVLDLFAGAGGLTAGLHSASSRFKTVGAVEWDKAAAASYEATYGQNLVYAGDIKEWLRGEVPTTDVIVGGPPCQGFSSLGKKDVEDERNSLWREYAETIRRAKPKFFVVENVAEFKKSPQYLQFKEETSKEGILPDYDFSADICNAADFGAAQSRRRTVIVGWHRDLGSPGELVRTHSAGGEPGLKPWVTVRDALKYAPRDPDRDDVFSTYRTEFLGKQYAGSFAVRDLHWSRNYTQLSKDRFAVIPPGGNRRALEPYPQLMSPCWTRHKTGSGDVMGRLHWDRPSVTIRTEFFKPEKGRYLHPEEHRAITHYEAALLQGFGLEHRFVGSRTDIARQIGNAVPIPLGAAIGRLLATAL